MELQQRGFPVNHKRVLAMMREDNLLCVRRPGFLVTTDSRHNLPVYPNLACGITLTAINHGVATITRAAQETGAIAGTADNHLFNANRISRVVFLTRVILMEAAFEDQLEFVAYFFHKNRASACLSRVRRMFYLWG